MYARRHDSQAGATGSSRTPRRPRHSVMHTMGPRPFLAGVTALGALLAVMMGPWTTAADAAQIASPWSPPVSVFGSRSASSSGTMAYSGDGRALVAQSRGGREEEGPARVDLATRTPAGRYRTFRDVAGQDPQVVAYGQTRAVLMRYLVEERGSVDSARVGVSYGRTSGDIDPVGVIDRVEVDIGIPPLMAASEDGRIAIVYNDGSERLYLAVREPGGDFERRLVGRAQSGDIALDVGANGDIVVAWWESNRVTARVQRRGHGLGRVENLGPANPHPTLDASVADNGQVAVAWSTVDLSDGRTGDFRTLSPTVVRAAIRPPGPNLFKPAQTLYDTGEPRRQPRTYVAIDSSAAGATAAWTAHQPDAQGTQRYPILTATTDAGGRFEAPTPIADEGDVEDIVVDPDASATVAWRPSRVDEQGGSLPSSELLAAVRPPGGATFGPAETVSDRYAAAPRFALNPLDGRPTLIWNGTGDTGKPALRASTRD